MDQFDVIANQPIVIDNVCGIYAKSVLFLTREKTGNVQALYRLFINKHGWLTLGSRDFFL